MSHQIDFDPSLSACRTAGFQQGRYSLLTAKVSLRFFAR